MLVYVQNVVPEAASACWLLQCKARREAWVGLACIAEPYDPACPSRFSWPQARLCHKTLEAYSAEGSRLQCPSSLQQHQCLSPRSICMYTSPHLHLSLHLFLLSFIINPFLYPTRVASLQRASGHSSNRDVAVAACSVCAFVQQS